MEPSITRETFFEVGDRVRLHPDATLPNGRSPVLARTYGGTVVAVYDYPQYEDVPTLYDVEFGVSCHPYTADEIVAAEAVPGA